MLVKQKFDTQWCILKNYLKVFNTTLKIFASDYRLHIGKPS